MSKASEERLREVEKRVVEVVKEQWDQLDQVKVQKELEELGKEIDRLWTMKGIEEEENKG